ncbi:MAG: Sec-independent protein translocase protein TatB [Pyrinomonadaceae bacterium]
MFLFIFESIGTSELILIGIVALIFLGPRRLPEMARKMGKMMAELRSATTEFKQTWEREVDFEAETKALRDLDAPVPNEWGERSISRSAAADTGVPAAVPEPPRVSPVDPGSIANLKNADSTSAHTSAEESPAVDPADKRNWL